MDPNTLKAIQGAAGAAGGDKVYVEDVFSTYLYEGNSASDSSGTEQDIPNGIDINGEGGMVWIKNRDEGTGTQHSHFLYDSERSDLKSLNTNDTWSEGANSDSLKAWNSGGGFKLGGNTDVNKDGDDFVSWTFRKAPGFFDIVTYDGTGSNQTLAHNLGCVPGMIIVKRLNASESWAAYHTGIGNNHYIKFDENGGPGGANDNHWQQTTPTATHFYLGGSDAMTNGSGSGDKYVAYLFAKGDDAGAEIFGDDGDESIIKCGSYTGNSGSDGPEITLGWEPQYVMIKCSTFSSDHTNWHIYDNMRGVTTRNSSTSPGGYDRSLSANLTTEEESGNNYANTDLITFTPTGFKIGTGGYTVNDSNNDYIYMAIRRGPMKTPEDATKVFKMNNKLASPVTLGFVPDLSIAKWSGDQQWYWIDRLRGDAKNLSSDLNTAEGTGLSVDWDADTNKITGSSTSTSYYQWVFGRAPGFFDIVCYTGTHPTVQTINHNLGVVPEMMIFKARSAGMAENWAVYHKDLSGANYYLQLNTNDDENTNSGMWHATDPTASVFTLGNDNSTNYNTGTFVAYLFATCSGVSMVGKYDGTAADVNVDCGFAAGARFVLIKRIDADASWYLFDSSRGIGSSNDPALSPDLSAGDDDQDYLSSYTGGFTVNAGGGSGVNADGGKYLFLAIA